MFKNSEGKTKPCSESLKKCLTLSVLLHMSNVLFLRCLEFKL